MTKPQPPAKVDDPEVEQEEGASNLNENALEDLPQDQRSIVVAELQRTEMQSGWLPAPDLLAQYEQILPGLAERIVALPEREQAHRHRVIEAAAKDDSRWKSRGQNFALLTAFGLIALAFFLAWAGDTTAAATVGSFGIIAVVSIFVTGKYVDLKLSGQSFFPLDDDETSK